MTNFWENTPNIVLKSLIDLHALYPDTPAALVISERELQENAEQFAAFCAEEGICSEPIPVLAPPPMPLPVLYAEAHGAAIVAERRYGLASAQYRQALALADGLRELAWMDGILEDGRVTK